MTLRQFLRDRNMSVVALQAAIGVRSRNTVYRYLRGEQVPRREIALRVVAATGGAVTLDDLYGAAPAGDAA